MITNVSDTTFFYSEFSKYYLPDDQYFGRLSYRSNRSHFGSMLIWNSMIASWTFVMCPDFVTFECLCNPIAWHNSASIRIQWDSKFQTRKNITFTVVPMKLIQGLLQKYKNIEICKCIFFDLLITIHL